MNNDGLVVSLAHVYFPKTMEENQVIYSQWLHTCHKKVSIEGMLSKDSNVKKYQDILHENLEEGIIFLRHNIVWNI